VITAITGLERKHISSPNIRSLLNPSCVEFILLTVQTKGILTRKELFMCEFITFAIELVSKAVC